MIALPTGFRKGLIVGAAVLTIGLGVLLGLFRHEIATAQAASEQAIADSQFYVDSSEMDTDLTEVALTDHTAQPTGSRLNGIVGLRQDGTALDKDLQQIRRYGDTSLAQQNLNAYRTQVAQVQTATTTASQTTAYITATTLAHIALLPSAAKLSTAPDARLTTAVNRARVLGIAGIVVAVLLGATLLGLALPARRPAGYLAASVVVILALTAVSITVLRLGDTRLSAFGQDITAAVAGQRASGDGYDAAADPARYLLSGKDHSWSSAEKAADPRIRGEAGGAAWIQWDVLDRTLTGLFAGIDAGTVKPSDVSLYNSDGGVNIGFAGFNHAVGARDASLVTAAAHRLSSARSPLRFWYLAPIAAAAILLLLLAWTARPRPARS